MKQVKLLRHRPALNLQVAPVQRLSDGAQIMFTPWPHWPSAGCSREASPTTTGAVREGRGYVETEPHWGDGAEGGRLEGRSPGAGAQHPWSPEEGKRLRGVQPCGCPDRAHLSPGTPGEHGPVVPVPGPLFTAAQLQEAVPRPLWQTQAPPRASTPRRDGLGERPSPCGTHALGQGAVAPVRGRPDGVHYGHVGSDLPDAGSLCLLSLFRITC